MSDTLYIMDYNPVLFLQAFEEAVLDGFYANDSVIGYPQLTAPNEITVFRVDQPEQRNDLTGMKTAVIQAYENVPFILNVQDAILQGFYIDVQDIQLSVPYAPHTVTLHRAAQGMLDVTPVASPTPQAASVSQSATEAPTTTQAKQPRKSKEV